MKRVFFYLMVILTGYGLLAYRHIIGPPLIENASAVLFLECGLFGGVGGILYCLRGIYLNACVRKDWDKVWMPWYFIRPVASLICGVISCLFLKAGLIVLEAEQVETASQFSFYALAFIAGLNVDRFIEKVEEIAEATWGIKKSRTTRREESHAA